VKATKDNTIFILKDIAERAGIKEGDNVFTSGVTYPYF
jgi:cell shape-determining protein MreC